MSVHDAGVSESVRLATAADLSSIGSLVEALCRDSAAHCIHSWSGESAAEHAAELARMLDDEELVYVVAESGGGLVGAFGCEFDAELGRGWLQGPHALTDWERVAGLLHTTLMAALPPAVTQLDAFLNASNQRAVAFYARRGFEQLPVRLYEFLLPPTTACARTAGVRLGEPHRASFFELFDRLFPKAYYSHDRLIELQGESLEILVAIEGDRVDGFCVASRAADGRRGEIQFLGVREERRGRGLGRQLLAAGVTWLRSVGVEEVALNTTDTREAARRLYERTGFELRYVGVGLRLGGSQSTS